jgi:DNA mismatch repair ATPase MutS
MKEQHPDFLLLFQIGDFYEMYFDGAISTRLNAFD